jgi:hypothetical protein
MTKITQQLISRMSFGQPGELGRQRFVCHPTMFVGVDIINDTFQVADMIRRHGDVPIQVIGVSV